MTPEQTLTERISPGSPFRETTRHLFGLKSRLDAEHSKLVADPTISIIGRRQRKAEFAKSLMKNFAELSRPLRRAKADAAARRASFKIPEFDRTDSVGELKRQEVRTYLRSLPLADLVNAIDLLGDDGVLAVLDAPPALSGLPPDRHEFIKTRYLEHRFGKQMRELESVDEDITAVESAAVMVRKDLQVATGLGDLDFAKLEKSHE